jgi:hypothetical protein
MSDTPRTDAEAFTMGIMAAKPGERPKDFVRGDVARTLERELAELSAEFQSQNHELGKALHRADDAERENAALRDQVRELEAEIACLTVDEQDRSTEAHARDTSEGPGTQAGSTGAVPVPSANSEGQPGGTL